MAFPAGAAVHRKSWAVVQPESLEEDHRLGRVDRPRGRRVQTETAEIVVGQTAAAVVALATCSEATAAVLDSDQEASSTLTVACFPDDPLRRQAGDPAWVSLAEDPAADLGVDLAVGLA